MSAKRVHSARTPNTGLHAAYANVDRIKSEGQLCAAFKHNLRECKDRKHADGTIDSSLSELNTRISGARSSEEGMLEFNRLYELAQGHSSRKIRCNFVRAIEVVVTWPPLAGREPDEYFCLVHDWVHQFYDYCVILSAVVHRDEQGPHMHVLLMPYIKGRLRGSDLIGGPGRLRLLQSSLHTNVTQSFGLARPKANRSMCAAESEAVVTQVMDRLRQQPSSFKLPDVEHCLKQYFKRDPSLIAGALGMAAVVGTSDVQ